MDKKKKIHELAKQEDPKLTRKEISDLVPCSPAFVTKTLGAVRPYNKKVKSYEIPNSS